MKKWVGDISAAFWMKEPRILRFKHLHDKYTDGQTCLLKDARTHLKILTKN